jgi:hypothetical protein
LEKRAGGRRQVAASSGQTRSNFELRISNVEFDELKNSRDSGVKEQAGGKNQQAAGKWQLAAGRGIANSEDSRTQELKRLRQQATGSGQRAGGKQAEGWRQRATGS